MGQLCPSLGSIYSIHSLYTMLLLHLTLLSSYTVLSLDTNNKAASFRVNCNCQCSDLTFRDKFNRIQGNCKTADNTGAQWCYTEYGSTCEDQQRSQRFGHQGKTWSYQACSTPPRNSPQCNGFGGGGAGIGGGICRHGYGSGCGNNGGFNGNNGGFGGNNGGFNNNNGGFNNNNGGFGGNNGGFNNGGSISNCRHGQNCNIGNNGQYNNGQYNNGQFSGTLASILNGRKTSKKKDSIKFGRK